MTLETELVLDRRRLSRRLTFWRIAAVLLGLGAAGALVAKSDSLMSPANKTEQIARVTIEGTITDDRAQLDMLRRAGEAKHVKAVLLAVNSPGGTTTGGEALFESIRDLSKIKPVVAVFGTMATSAAYIVGLSSDYIVARGNTITGSVGVIFSWPEFSQLFDKVGVKMNEIKSGPLKANPSPFQPLDAAGKELAERMVAESQKWFLGLVASRRGIDTASIPGLEQGRIFSGREALTFKLVDQIGGERDAIKWLEQKRNIAEKLKVIDWKPKRPNDLSFWTGASANAAVWLLGPRFEPLIAALLQDGAGWQGQLDGLKSVWHPGGN